MLNACDIADGMLIYGHAEGGELQHLNQQSGPRNTTISGPAYTVEFVPKDDPRPAVSSHYIDSVPAGSVLVIATSPECQTPLAPFTKVRQSLYGGLMSRRAQFLKAKGTVVLGLIRDIGEQEELNYPVFSYGVGTCAANKTMKVVNVNKPLQVGENHTIQPGDLVYADVNGVTVVPAEEHDAVIKAAEGRAKANEYTAKDIAAGETCQNAQKQRREQFG